MARGQAGAVCAAGALAEVCLLGVDVVPVSFGGKTAGQETRGHRVLHGEAPVLIAAPGEYEPARC